MAFGSILVPLTVVSIQCRLSSDHTRAAPLPLSITISSSSPLPPALSLRTIPYHPIPLFWWTMGVMVVVPSFFSSSEVIDLLLRGACLVMVPVSLPSIAAVATLPSPLSYLGTVCVMISAPAVMGVGPPSPAFASLPALPVPVAVPVMLPGVRVEVVTRRVMPEIPCLIPSSFRRPAGFFAVLGLHHERPVQVSLHVRVQVEGGGHLEALLRVELVEQSLAARPHVVSPQLVGPLLPH